MKKKFLAIMYTTLALSTMFAGCSSDDSDSKSTDSTNQTQQQDNTNDGQQATDSVAKGTLEYSFADAIKDKAGYAQGDIKLTVDKAGTYNVYWANDDGVLPGYYPIFSGEAKENEALVASLGENVAIPSDATKVIAVEAVDGKSDYTLADAIATYDVDASKQMHKSSETLYTFSSISDVHIDEEHWSTAPAYWWEYSEDHWAKMLDYATDKNVDFIISSGDQVTNANFGTLDKEWKAYEYILSQSDYVNPIYESGGNHEVRQDGKLSDELAAYVVGSGMDNTIESLSSNKSYYYITEPKTGDMFIFMSLEGGYRAGQYDEFTAAQLDWLENLLKDNYNKGKNIYIVQHALIKGYGAGDNTETPYYTAAMLQGLETTQRFMSIIETYTENVVWISGHSHMAFSEGYNYSNNGGKSCNMIHNSSVGNPTHVVNNAINYDFNEDQSEGYYVEVFEDSIVFYGANVVDGKIYPSYSYIMDGKTTANTTTDATADTTADTTTDTTTDATTDAAADTTTDATTDAADAAADATAVTTTPGNLRSIIANARTVLGLYYEYSSYDQYQALKKLYYEYKDVASADIDALSDSELSATYNDFATKISELYTITNDVSKLELTVQNTKE